MTTQAWFIKKSKTKEWIDLSDHWKEYIEFIKDRSPTLQEFIYHYAPVKGERPESVPMVLARVFIEREMIPMDSMIRLYQYDHLKGIDYCDKLRQNIVMKGDALFQATVVARDCCCVKCEKVEGISGHHLVRRKYLRSRHDTRNGVSLCKECHDWAHVHPDNDEWLAWKREGALFTEPEWRAYLRFSKTGQKITDDFLSGKTWED